jgi:signal transduction histidine kinase
MRFHRPGVQMRSALAASAVVAVASILAGIALVLAVNLLLVDNVDQSATQRAEQVAAVLNDSSGNLVAAVRPSARDRSVVQVLGPSGHIVAASPGIGSANPISPMRPGAGDIQRETRHLAFAHDATFRVVAIGVQDSNASGGRTVLVAQTLDEVDDATEALTAALAVGLPLLTLVVGTATFVFVGRTLRPVEAMRRQAATISASNLHTRLPVPDTADEIAALATTMNTMLTRIEAASAAQHRFVADASHELRSPLTTINLGLELLAGADLPPEVSAQVSRMAGESARMRRLIDDLLLLARVDESGLQLRHEDVDLDDAVYAERERITAERPDLRVEVKVTPARITGDAHHLQRALRNLVDNAARHAKSTVALTLDATPDTVELTVADDGPGIPEADRRRVFDRFVRLDDDRSRQGGGTGLGLPITRDIVTAHGGTVTVDRSPSGGAAVLIRLPR